MSPGQVVVEMELTRRDALEALAVGGLASGGSLVAAEGIDRTDLSRPDSSLSGGDFSTLEAVADVIYPSRVEVTTEYIETYVSSFDDDRKESVSRAVRDLNDLTRSRYGAAFHELSPSTRDAALRSLGVNRAKSRESGKAVERIRYHLVNSLLYALFTTPRGSELVGIRNPVGHPGGYESLVRAPDGESGDG